MEIENQKRISLKRLVGAAKAPEKGQTIWLAIVAGCCVGTKSGEGDLGPYNRFDGDFIAKGLVGKGRANEIIASRAPQLLVPQAAEDMLLADGVGDEGTFTEFVLKIGVQADDKGRPAYVAEYLSKPVQTSPADVLWAKHGETATAPTGTAPAAPGAKGGGKK